MTGQNYGRYQSPIAFGPCECYDGFILKSCAGAAVPLHYKIDHDHRIVHATMQGLVVLKDLLDYFDAVTVQEAASYAKLFDGTGGELQLSDDDVMTLGARVSAYAAYDPRGPVAAVALGQ